MQSYLEVVTGMDSSEEQSDISNRYLHNVTLIVLYVPAGMYGERERPLLETVAADG